MQKMLDKDPEKRASVSELIDDPWLTRFKKHPLEIFTAADASCQKEEGEASSSDDEVFPDGDSP